MGWGRQQAGVVLPKNVKDAPEKDPRPLTMAEEMKPLLVVMRQIFLMPIHFPGDGSAKFTLRSGTMYFNYVGCGIFIVDSAQEAVYRMTVLLDCKNFSDAVFQTFFYILLHTHFFTPFLHWPAAPGFVRYLDRWTEFQGRFRRVTGRPLALSVRPLALHKSVAALLVPLVLCCITALTMKTANWKNQPLGWIAAAFQACVPAFWDVLGTAVVNASTALAGHFREEVTAAGGVPEPSRVRAYRELWLELRELTEGTTKAWGVCTMHYVLVATASVLVAGFGVLAQCTEGISNPILFTVMFLISVDSLWHISVLCSAGHRMQGSVGGAARDVLLSMRTSGRAGGPDMELLQSEVNYFLIVMRKPPVISLYGYITLKLTLTVTILETLMTYLCVLLSFAVSFQFAP
ncbi:Gustatory receptor 2 [Frankliniella occidentalis]|nr:Gustatory receptor 2 [Frankliniella occidentalis]